MLINGMLILAITSATAITRIGRPEHHAEVSYVLKDMVESDSRPTSKRGYRRVEGDPEERDSDFTPFDEINSIDEVWDWLRFMAEVRYMLPPQLTSTPSTSTATGPLPPPQARPPQHATTTTAFHLFTKRERKV